MGSGSKTHEHCFFPSLSQPRVRIINSITLGIPRGIEKWMGFFFLSGTRGPLMTDGTQTNNDSSCPTHYFKGLRPPIARDPVLLSRRSSKGQHILAIFNGLSLGLRLQKVFKALGEGFSHLGIHFKIPRRKKGVYLWVRILNFDIFFRRILGVY